MRSFIDPLLMPVTGETALQRLDFSMPIEGTMGQLYIEKRGIQLSTAQEASLRYDANWNGREAIIVPMRDMNGVLCGLHGRYLQITGHQNKMFTMGREGGIIKVSGPNFTESVILVEGLFDALSVATSGYSAIATIGRWTSWLPDYCLGKRVFAAFDACRSGEEAYQLYKQRLVGADVHRLLPPDRCKDWNTALLKKGDYRIARCIQNALHL
jgi:DNA primase